MGLILISCNFLYLHFITTSPNNRRQLLTMTDEPIPFVKVVQKL